MDAPRNPEDASPVAASPSLDTENAPVNATDIASIVICISGRGSNMRAIDEACRAGIIRGRVVAVLSNRADAAGLDYARGRGIPTHVLGHKDFTDRAAYDAALAALIAPYAPDVVCLAGFMRILTPVFIAPFAGRILNIHPSLLPKYKGLDTHQRAIEAGDSEAGCSVHIVTAELDGGPVILQKRVPILAGDDADTLAARVLAQEHGAYIEAINAFLSAHMCGSSGASSS